jgi:antitoxin YefM
MNVKTYSHARQNFAKLMDEAADSRAPIIVTRRGAESIVILPLGEYEAMEETFHLMRSPKNAARLLESIKQAEAGQLIRRDPTKARAKRK